MDHQPLFVGRREELARWEQVLGDPRGQAVLIVGPSGMGKTFLADRMAQRAREHPTLSCGAIRYEATENDSVDPVLGRMLSDAYDAAGVKQGSFAPTAHRREQWRALLNVVKVGDLLASLREEHKLSRRDEFVKQMSYVSQKMSDRGRAVFIIDAKKTLHAGSDQDWAIVVRGLPPKVKLVFGQRSEDVLVDSALFRGLAAEGLAVRIPDGDLDVLDDEGVEQLVADSALRSRHSAKELREAIGRYKNHPYAVPAALDLIEAGTDPAKLPDDPTPEGIAGEQWKKIGRGGTSGQNGAKAIDLFQAYAVLEVPATDEAARAVAGVSAAEYKSLLADRFLGSLLRGEGDRRRIYHDILGVHVRSQIGEDEMAKYHHRAIEHMRGKLADAKAHHTKPDAFAAERLPTHVMMLDGPTDFVDAIIDECAIPLRILGLYDALLCLLDRALICARPKSRIEANVMSTIGIVHRARGNLAGAERTLLSALTIYESVGDQPGMASAWNNLGNVYAMQGDLDRAQEAYLKASAKAIESGHVEGMALVSGNLGNIFSERGDWRKAAALSQRALEITRGLNHRVLGASALGNLADIYRQRGDLRRAWDSAQCSLAMSSETGDQEGIAHAQSVLGMIHMQRGDFAEARRLGTMARDIYAQIGMAHMVEKVQGWLDGLEGQ